MEHPGNLHTLLEHWDSRVRRLKHAFQQHPPELTELLNELENNRLVLLQLLEEQDLSRRLIEQARREWTAAFDAVQDPIFMHDNEFRVVRANLAYARRAGLPIQDVLGKPYWELFPRRDGPLPGCRQALGDEAHHEEEIRLENGAVFCSRTYPIQDVDGGYLFSLHIMQDITERKRAEQSLAASELRYRTLFNEMLNGFSLHELILDAHGTAVDYRFLEINPAFEQLTGLRRKQLLGCTAREVLADDAPFWVSVYGEVTLSGEPRRFIGYSAAFDKYYEVLAFRTGERQFATIFGDVSLDVWSQRTLRKATRALETLSACNVALVHATDETDLLKQVCRIIVEIGGYHQAWVGFVEHDGERQVRPVADAGYEPGFLDRLRIAWSNGHGESDLAATAIRTGRPVVSTRTDPDTPSSHWCVPAQAGGHGVSIAIPLHRDETVFGVLCICSTRADAFDADVQKLLRELADDLAFGIVTLGNRSARTQAEARARQHLESLNKAMEQTIEAVALTVEKRDPYTAGHQQRVADLAAAIARELHLPPDQIQGIYFGGLIHDIGKIYVPAEILSRPGRLSEAEYNIIKTHPQVGYDIVKGVAFPWPVAQMVLQHHERLDGSGYPHALKTEQILVEARILAVADVVEAMVSHRPYRAARGADAALAEIEQGRGTRYDTQAVDACLRLFREQGYTLDAPRMT